MMINTNNLVSITEANQNFSKVARSVDQNGAAVILKNNMPKYILLGYDEFMSREDAGEDITTIARRILDDNREAFKRLAE